MLLLIFSKKLLSLPLFFQVASIIGHVFSLKMLEGVFPIPSSKPNLMANLIQLDRLGLISEYIHHIHDYMNQMNGDKNLNKWIIIGKSLSQGLMYNFKDIMIRDVVYNLMLFEQRRELHVNVAKWIEHNVLRSHLHKTDILISFSSLLFFSTHQDFPLIPPKYPKSI